MSIAKETIGDNDSFKKAKKTLKPEYSTQFKPCDLLDALVKELDLKNDAALSRALELTAPLISKLRSQASPVSAFVLIRMHEVSGLGIAELRGLMGDHRKKFGVSDESKMSDSGHGKLKP